MKGKKKSHQQAFFSWQGCGIYRGFVTSHNHCEARRHWL